MRNPSSPGRVILTYGRSLMALTAAHSLGDRGIEVIGCDSVNMTVLKFSRYVSDNFIHAPYEDNIEQYLDDLEANIRKFKPDDDRPYILMPMFRDARILARHRDRFDGLIEIAAPPTRAIDHIQPKDVFARTCDNIGLSAPLTHACRTNEELEEIKDTLTYPVLVKPVEGSGGRGIEKVDYKEALTKAYETAQNADPEHPPLVQEAIAGEDYCLSAICDKGEIIAHMAYKNLYEYPPGAGSGIMRETVDDAPFLPCAQKLMRELEWHGVVQFDFRWDGEAEEAHIIEVNPRFWAGLFHSVESGADFPWYQYQLFANGAVSDTSPVKLGAKTKIPGIWTLSAVRDIAEHDLDFDRLKDVWAELWQSEDHKPLREKLAQFKEAAAHSFNPHEMMDHLKDVKQQGQSARSELDIDNDPYISLGVLFVMSSLARYGELPYELKSG